MSDPFLGEIRTVGFDFAPTGWALCAGQLMAISQNAALFSLLGVNFGGNGTTNFQLPDLQGRSAVGTGNGTGLSPIIIGEKNGVENVTLTNQTLPSHTHTSTTASYPASLSGSISIPATTTTTGATNTPGITAVLGPATSAGHPATVYNTSAANTNLLPFTATLTGTVNPGTSQIGLTGSGLPIPIRNPYLGLTCIIALAGIFPSRG
jgi:microcystin-dependent protein